MCKELYHMTTTRHLITQILRQRSSVGGGEGCIQHFGWEV
jgi:hypothetical protein